MRKPNFLIVGAAKCGTTSLFEYLRQHPQIYLPPQKEISYFAGRSLNDINSMENYLTYFKAATNELAIGEASAAYLFSPDAAKRIHHELGSDIKIIILLRNPVDMMYSLWGHNKRIGGETLSFKDALAAEPCRMKDQDFHKYAIGWSYNYAYTARATFSAQIQPYLKMFGHERVRIYIYEEFFSNLRPGLSDVFAFLGVNSDFQIDHSKRYNAMGEPHSRLLQRILVQPYWWTYPIRIVLPNRFRRIITMHLNTLNTRQKPLPSLTEKYRNELKSQCLDDITEVEHLLNRKLSGLWY